MWAEFATGSLITISSQFLFECGVQAVNVLKKVNLAVLRDHGGYIIRSYRNRMLEFHGGRFGPLHGLLDSLPWPAGFLV